MWLLSQSSQVPKETNLHMAYFQWSYTLEVHLPIFQLRRSDLATAANVADNAVAPELLHGEEAKVRGDQA